MVLVPAVYLWCIVTHSAAAVAFHLVSDAAPPAPLAAPLLPRPSRWRS